jgi:hypothetical protein
MDIKEFVSDTLKQIIDGVVDAQQYAKTKRAVVAPYHDYQKNIGFDIAVTVDESKQKEGKAGITVWSVGGGVSGKTESSSSTVSRIKFEIPIELPQGSEMPPIPREERGAAYNDYDPLKL